MHDHVNAPVEETPLLLKAADPMRAEVVTPTAFVLRWRKSKEKGIQTCLGESADLAVLLR
jgi:hypothetical protein